MKTLTPEIHTFRVPGFAPEDVLLGPDNSVYTGLRDGGTILKINVEHGVDHGTVEEFAHAGGLPLGLEWMPDGRMLICNAALGLQTLDMNSRTITPLPINNDQLHIANNAAVTDDGTIYISDSSSVFPLPDFRKDIIQDTKSGRLLRISPDGDSMVLMTGLSFANGVALLPDAKTVLVAETAKDRIHKISLDGTAPTVFAETPGLPDNLSIGTDGLIWCALPSRPNAALAKLHASPLFIRQLTSLIPDSWQPNAAPCCRVVAYDIHGNLVHQIEGDPAQFHSVTGVREHHGRVYLGSIEQDRIAWFDL